MDGKSRRSSILKPQKPRNPLSDLDFTEPVVDETNILPPSRVSTSRRVSFASSNFVKEFVADPDKNTIWNVTYEEAANSTDNSAQSTETSNNPDQISEPLIDLNVSIYNSLPKTEPNSTDLVFSSTPVSYKTKGAVSQHAVNVPRQPLTPLLFKPDLHILCSSNYNTLAMDTTEMMLDQDELKIVNKSKSGLIVSENAKQTQEPCDVSSENNSMDITFSSELDKVPNPPTNSIQVGPTSSSIINRAIENTNTDQITKSTSLPSNIDKNKMKFEPNNLNYKSSSQLVDEQMPGVEFQNNADRSRSQTQFSNSYSNEFDSTSKNIGYPELLLPIQEQLTHMDHDSGTVVQSQGRINYGAVSMDLTKNNSIKYKQDDKNVTHTNESMFSLSIVSNSKLIENNSKNLTNTDCLDMSVDASDPVNNEADKENVPCNWSISSNCVTVAMDFTTVVKPVQCSFSTHNRIENSIEKSNYETVSMDFKSSQSFTEKDPVEIDEEKICSSRNASSNYESSSMDMTDIIRQSPLENINQFKNSYNVTSENAQYQELTKPSMDMSIEISELVEEDEHENENIDLSAAPSKILGEGKIMTERPVNTTNSVLSQSQKSFPLINVSSNTDNLLMGITLPKITSEEPNSSGIYSKINNEQFEERLERNVDVLKKSFVGSVGNQSANIQKNATVNMSMIFNTSFDNSTSPAEELSSDQLNESTKKNLQQKVETPNKSLLPANTTDMKTNLPKRENESAKDKTTLGLSISSNLNNQTNETQSELGNKLPEFEDISMHVADVNETDINASSSKQRRIVKKDITMEDVTGKFSLSNVCLLQNVDQQNTTKLPLEYCHSIQVVELPEYSKNIPGDFRALSNSLSQEISTVNITQRKSYNMDISNFSKAESEHISPRPESKTPINNFGESVKILETESKPFEHDVMAIFNNSLTNTSNDSDGLVLNQQYRKLLLEDVEQENTTEILSLLNRFKNDDQRNSTTFWMEKICSTQVEEVPIENKSSKEDHENPDEGVLQDIAPINITNRKSFNMNLSMKLDDTQATINEDSVNNDELREGLILNDQSRKLSLVQEDNTTKALSTSSTFRNDEQEKSNSAQAGEIRNEENHNLDDGDLRGISFVNITNRKSFNMSLSKNVADTVPIFSQLRSQTLDISTKENMETIFSSLSEPLVQNAENEIPKCEDASMELTRVVKHFPNFDREHSKVEQSADSVKVDKPRFDMSMETVETVRNTNENLEQSENRLEEYSGINENDILKNKESDLSMSFSDALRINEQYKKLPSRDVVMDNTISSQRLNFSLLKNLDDQHTIKIPLERLPRIEINEIPVTDEKCNRTGLSLNVSNFNLPQNIELVPENSIINVPNTSISLPPNISNMDIEPTPTISSGTMDKSKIDSTLKISNMDVTNLNIEVFPKTSGINVSNTSINLPSNISKMDVADINVELSPKTSNSNMDQINLDSLRKVSNMDVTNSNIEVFPKTSEINVPNTSINLSSNISNMDVDNANIKPSPKTSNIDIDKTNFDSSLKVGDVDITNSSNELFSKAFEENVLKTNINKSRNISNMDVSNINIELFPKTSSITVDKSVIDSALNIPNMNIEAFPNTSEIKVPNTNISLSSNNSNMDVTNVNSEPSPKTSNTNMHKTNIDSSLKISNMDVTNSNIEVFPKTTDINDPNTSINVFSNISNTDFTSMNIESSPKISNVNIDKTNIGLTLKTSNMDITNSNTELFSETSEVNVPKTDHNLSVNISNMEVTNPKASNINIANESGDVFLNIQLSPKTCNLIASNTDVHISPKMCNTNIGASPSTPNKETSNINLSQNVSNINLCPKTTSNMSVTEMEISTQEKVFPRILCVPYPKYQMKISPTSLKLLEGDCVINWQQCEETAEENKVLETEERVHSVDELSAVVELKATEECVTSPKANVNAEKVIDGLSQSTIKNDNKQNISSFYKPITLVECVQESNPVQEDVLNLKSTPNKEITTDVLAGDQSEEIAGENADLETKIKVKLVELRATERYVKSPKANVYDENVMDSLSQSLIKNDKQNISSVSNKTVPTILVECVQESIPVEVDILNFKSIPSEEITTDALAGDRNNCTNEIENMITEDNEIDKTQNEGLETYQLSKTVDSSLISKKACLDISGSFEENSRNEDNKFSNKYAVVVIKDEQNNQVPQQETGINYKSSEHALNKSAVNIKSDSFKTPSSSFHMDPFLYSPCIDDTQHLINYKLSNKKTPKSEFSQIIAGDIDLPVLPSNLMHLSGFRDEFDMPLIEVEARQHDVSELPVKRTNITNASVRFHDVFDMSLNQAHANNPHIEIEDQKHDISELPAARTNITNASIRFRDEFDVPLNQTHAKNSHIEIEDQKHDVSELPAAKTNITNASIPMRDEFDVPLNQTHANNSHIEIEDQKHDVSEFPAAKTNITNASIRFRDEFDVALNQTHANNSHIEVEARQHDVSELPVDRTNITNASVRFHDVFDTLNQTQANNSHIEVEDQKHDVSELPAAKTNITNASVRFRDEFDVPLNQTQANNSHIEIEDQKHNVSELPAAKTNITNASIRIRDEFDVPLNQTQANNSHIEVEAQQHDVSELPVERTNNTNASVRFHDVFDMSLNQTQANNSHIEVEDQKHDVSELPAARTNITNASVRFRDEFDVPLNQTHANNSHIEIEDQKHNVSELPAAKTNITNASIRIHDEFDMPLNQTHVNNSHTEVEERKHDVSELPVERTNITNASVRFRDEFDIPLNQTHANNSQIEDEARQHYLSEIPAERTNITNTNVLATAHSVEVDLEKKNNLEKLNFILNDSAHIKTSSSKTSVKRMSSEKMENEVAKKPLLDIDCVENEMIKADSSKREEYFEPMNISLIENIEQPLNDVDTKQMIFEEAAMMDKSSLPDAQNATEVAKNVELPTDDFHKNLLATNISVPSLFTNICKIDDTLTTRDGKGIEDVLMLNPDFDQTRGSIGIQDTSKSRMSYFFTDTDAMEETNIEKSFVKESVVQNNTYVLKKWSAENTRILAESTVETENTLPINRTYNITSKMKGKENAAPTYLNVPVEKHIVGELPSVLKNVPLLNKSVTEPLNTTERNISFSKSDTSRKPCQANCTLNTSSNIKNSEEKECENASALTIETKIQETTVHVTKVNRTFNVSTKVTNWNFQEAKNEDTDSTANRKNEVVELIQTDQTTNVSIRSLHTIGDRHDGIVSDFNSELIHEEIAKSDNVAENEINDNHSILARSALEDSVHLSQESVMLSNSLSGDEEGTMCSEAISDSKELSIHIPELIPKPLDQELLGNFKTLYEDYQKHAEERRARNRLRLDEIKVRIANRNGALMKIKKMMRHPIFNVDYENIRPLVRKTVTPPNNQIEIPPPAIEQEQIQVEVEDRLESKVETIPILSVEDKIQEQFERCRKVWKPLKYQHDHCIIETLYRCVRFLVVLEPHGSNVISYEIKNNMNEKSTNLAKFAYNVFVSKMNMVTVQKSIGSVFTVYSFLDYIAIHMQKVDELMKQLTKLECRYLLEMDEKFITSFKVLSLKLKTVWFITVDLSNLDNINQESVIEIGHRGLEKDQFIRKLVDNCPKGPDFIFHFARAVENLLEGLEVMRINRDLR